MSSIWPKFQSHYFPFLWSLVSFSPLLYLPYYHHGVSFIIPYPSRLNCNYLKQLIQPKYGVNLYKKNPHLPPQKKE